MIKLSLIVPCYNEGKNIPLLLNRFKEIIRRDDIEILLVNNGSQDNTAEIINKFIHDYSFAKVITVEINQGYGYGILAGLKEAKGEFIGWTHADLQTDPYDAIRALETLESQEDPRNVYVKGKRVGRSLFDNFFTFGMSIFETIYLGKKLWDINAQPNIFSREFFNAWKNPPHDFSLDLYALYMAKCKNLKIIRFNVFFPQRVHGHSSWNTGFRSKWKFIKRTVVFSKKLKKELSK